MIGCSVSLRLTVTSPSLASGDQQLHGRSKLMKHASRTFTATKVDVKASTGVVPPAINRRASSTSCSAILHVLLFHREPPNFHALRIKVPALKWKSGGGVGVGELHFRQIASLRQFRPVAREERGSHYRLGPKTTRRRASKI